MTDAMPGLPADKKIPRENFFSRGGRMTRLDSCGIEGTQPSAELVVPILDLPHPPYPDRVDYPFVNVPFRRTTSHHSPQWQGKSR